MQSTFNWFGLYRSIHARNSRVSMYAIDTVLSVTFPEYRFVHASKILFSRPIYDQFKRNSIHVNHMQLRLGTEVMQDVMNVDYAYCFVGRGGFQAPLLLSEVL